MKDKNKIKTALRLKKARRIKSRMSGTAEKPRLVVFRSLKHIYAQLVDDVSGNTLVTSSTAGKELKDKGSSGGKVELSKLVGMRLADEAKKKKITAAVFDRNGYLYHGRVKAVAEGARENGLKI
ncbi:50S ribosomal protein L18 [Candidatus Marinimicrobia bacterium MT.SAG.2]|nr:50S ribosomal protein L18 [Candidatus Neomarinimicrobiota bacterium]TFB11565.1 50S ribosomal protein L18 [Candidatus Marinimicrobia bacterium MT.SAG.2]